MTLIPLPPGPCLLRWFERFGLFTAVLLLAGCPAPQTTRLPTLEQGHPLVEKRSMERHDPFPDRELGPDTYARPREFNDQRTQTRRALEERMLQGMQGVGPAPPQIPGAQYPDAVRH